MTLYPVVLPIIQSESSIVGGEKSKVLRRAARKALQLSAEKSGVVLGEIKKDKNGVPCPFRGNYWSLSHKPKCVAAVIGREEIGIDIEEIKPRPESLFDYLATEEEWKLSKEKTLDTFFRYWTAKEATLKSMGAGIGKLKKCRVISPLIKNQLTLEYGDGIFSIEQMHFQGHMVSVVNNNNAVEWIVGNNQVE